MSMRDLQGIRTGEIVGVVADVKYENLGEEVGAAYYMSYLQLPMNEMALAARARGGGDAASLAPALRAAVLEADKDRRSTSCGREGAALELVARERFQVLLSASSRLSRSCSRPSASSAY